MAVVQGELRSIQARCETSDDGELRLILEGVLDAETTSRVWRRLERAVAKAGAEGVLLDATEIDYCDGTGIALLYTLRRIQDRRGGAFEIIGLKEEFSRLLRLFDPREFQGRRLEPRKGEGFLVEVGRLAERVARDTSELFAFLGELAAAFAAVLRRPGRARWRDAIRTAEMTGANALPLVAMVSLLMGLVMAFQAAIPLKLFGADIFVANLVGLSVIRELGPLLTAIILAGRTGSAFAAEIGTMKVNEEVNALITMGLDPVRFLALPRVLGTVLVAPLLTVFANLFGLLGGCLVMLSLGFPLITYMHQIVIAVDHIDLAGGLVKSVVFGFLVAAVGCLRGLGTQSGASSVGRSTTHAVVNAIVLIIVTDGVFSVIYYYLGI